MTAADALREHYDEWLKGDWNDRDEIMAAVPALADALQAAEEAAAASSPRALMNALVSQRDALAAVSAALQGKEPA